MYSIAIIDIEMHFLGLYDFGRNVEIEWACDMKRRIFFHLLASIGLIATTAHMAIAAETVDPTTKLFAISWRQAASARS
jgi:hypothetical protein